MKIAITLSLAALLLFAIVCGAQTNGIENDAAALNRLQQITQSQQVAWESNHAGWTLGSTNPPPAAWKWKTANDAAELIGDFGIHVTGKEILSIIGALVAASGAARGLRKFLPDSWQANKWGVWLAHIALEVNPTISKLKEAAQSPEGQSIDALIEAKVNQRVQTLANPLPASAFIPQPQPPATAIKSNP